MPKILENPKENILFIGKEILTTKGYKNLNIRSITKECGISTGTFYNYFSNKDTLVKEIINSDWKVIKKNLDKIILCNTSLKHKLQITYNNVDDFLKKYISAFHEIMNNMENKYCQSIHGIDLISKEIEKILIFHKKNGDIKTEITVDKLSTYIAFNMVCLSRGNYLNFDEFYSLLNL